MWPFSFFLGGTVETELPLIFCHCAKFIFHILPCAHFRYRANKLCHLRWINFAARSPSARAPTLAIPLFHLISIKVPFFVVFFVSFAFFFVLLVVGDFCFVSCIVLCTRHEENGRKKNATCKNYFRTETCRWLLFCVRWAVTWQQISSTPIKINWKIFKWEALDGRCRCRRRSIDVTTNAAQHSIKGVMKNGLRCRPR